MLRVYYADISGLDILPALCHLSAYRREKLEKSKYELAKKQGAGAELLLIHAVRELHPQMPLPLDIAVDEFEKPFLKKGELHFNLSHSGDYALCAVSVREVGADIQQQKPFNEQLVRRFFTAEELDYILSDKDLDYAFTKIWAMKESYIKAMGQGLKIPLNSFSVFEEFKSFRHKCIDGYHIAVYPALEERTEYFREIDLGRLSFG